MVSAQELIDRLGLKPHKEGGFFAESYRAPERLAVNALPPRYSGARSLSTAIYYLITPESYSRLHRLRSDEVFHFYLGDPVGFLLLQPDGKGSTAIVGPDVMAGQSLQLVVRRGTWQGARLLPGGRFALLGTTIAPGFEYDDFEEGGRAELVKAFPAFRKRIEELSS
ncbi:MAG: cupin domain-containing protein [Euryarchaeota archaeon]|nr:cupin domain-containing protein [Euryarchaeota archaeon]